MRLPDGHYPPAWEQSGFAGFPVCGCDESDKHNTGKASPSVPPVTDPSRDRTTGNAATTGGTRPYGRRDANYFGAILQDMREETLNDLRNYEEALRNITDNVSGDTYDDDVAVRLNASLEASSLEELAGLSNRQKKLLSHMDAALERIKDRTYGLCGACGRRIPRERLEAVPHATLCLVCKTGRAA